MVFLLYAVVYIIQKVESSCNYVWQVERLRGFAQRFSSYMSVILIGPVLVFTALGVTATAMNNTMVQQLMSVEPFADLIVLFSKRVPYLLVIAAFIFIYMFMVADHYLNQRDPWASEDLADYLALPMQPIHHVLKLMLDAGFLSETSDSPPAYLPRRDIETITLSELYEVVRSAGENRLLSLKTFPHQLEVEQAMEAVQRTVEVQLGCRTVKDPVQSEVNVSYPEPA